MTEPVQLFRIKVGISTGGASWGDWQYFEDEAQFKERLLDHAISAHSRNNQGRERAWLGSKWWMERVLKRPDEKKWTDKVFAAEKLVNGQWVEIEYEFLPPRLEFK